MTLHPNLAGLALAITAVLILGACNKPTPAAPEPEAPVQATADTATGMATEAAIGLDAYHWRLDTATAADGSRIDALFGNADAPLQLDFSDGRVSVSNTCNRMGGEFTLDADAITVAPMMATQMACPEPLMAMESAARDRITGSHTLTLEPGEPPQLTLASADGDTLVFHGAPTAETRYGSAGTRMFFEVAAQREPCSHPLIPDMQCLMVREVQYDDDGRQTRVSEAWEPLYQEIEGYEHEPGVRNVLRLKRFDIADPPADASSAAYVLDMVVESESVDVEE